MRRLLTTSTILLLLIPMVGFAMTETKYIIGVNGLTCPFCAYGLEKKLKKVPGVESVTIDLKKDQAVVLAKADHTLDEQALRKAVQKAGFTVASLKKVQVDPRGQESRLIPPGNHEAQR